MSLKGLFPGERGVSLFEANIWKKSSPTLEQRQTGVWMTEEPHAPHESTPVAIVETVDTMAAAHEQVKELLQEL